MTSSVPYDELDTRIKPLVEAVNALPGIVTLGSCAGHPDPKPGQYPEGRWYVKFQVEHNEEGWRSLEFLAWIASDLQRGNYAVILEAKSPPPYLNYPGASLSFVLEGEDVDPEETVARFLSQMHADCYVAVGEEDDDGEESHEA